jgi:hypothetical protein
MEFGSGGRGDSHVGRVVMRQLWGVNFCALYGSFGLIVGPKRGE